MAWFDNLMSGAQNLMADYPALNSIFSGAPEPQQVPVTPPLALPNTGAALAGAVGGGGGTALTNPYDAMTVPQVAGPGTVPLTEGNPMVDLPTSPEMVTTPNPDEDLWGFLSSPQMQLAAIAMGTGMIGGQDIGTAFQQGLQTYTGYEDRKNKQAQQTFQNQLELAKTQNQQTLTEGDQALRKRGQDIDLETLDFTARDKNADRQFRKELAGMDADLRIKLQREDKRNKEILAAMKAKKDSEQFNDKTWKAALDMAKASAGTDPETLEPNPVDPKTVFQYYNSLASEDEKTYLTANSNDVTGIMDELGAADGDLATQQGIVDQAVMMYGRDILPIIEKRLNESRQEPEAVQTGDESPGVSGARASMTPPAAPVTAPPSYMMPQTQPPAPAGYPFSFMG
jgi:hypothetical protein